MSNSLIPAVMVSMLTKGGLNHFFLLLFFTISSYSCSVFEYLSFLNRDTFSALILVVMVLSLFKCAR